MFHIGLLQIKCLKYLIIQLFSKDDFFSCCRFFNNITFLSDYMGFNTIDLNNINLDDNDTFDENNPERSY